MIVRTRFAPSPTGYLHVGGARTALFSYLYAKKYGGQFLLRIEDTDVVRSTEASVQAIFDGMAWLGLVSDEQPVFQTSRFARYRELAYHLLETGKAYKCYCTKERLEVLRQQQIQNKEKPRYDGCCRNAKDTDLPYVLRFDQPKEGDVIFNDLILGDIRVANEELDDLIILRSDGTPTYNFTVVVDDAEMRITHVIRGNDHVNNTPRQIQLFHALGLEPPQYAHVPMILGDDGQRLSKRHGAVSVMQYKEEGYLPQALLNYLVRLGWAYGDQEIFSIEEMITHFDLSKVSKSAAAFNTEKLQWLNQQYIKSLPAELLLEPLKEQYEATGVDISQGPDLSLIIHVFRDRAKTLKDMAEVSRFCFEAPKIYDQQAWERFMDKNILVILHEQLSNVSDWTQANLHNILQMTVKELDVKFPAVAQPLRIAVTGSVTSPAMDITLSLLRQYDVLTRIQAAIDHS